MLGTLQWQHGRDYLNCPLVVGGDGTGPVEKQWHRRAQPLVRTGFLREMCTEVSHLDLEKRASQVGSSQHSTTGGHCHRQSPSPALQRQPLEVLYLEVKDCRITQLPPLPVYPIL